MSERERPRDQFIHTLPPNVFCSFCRVMDGLSDLDWTRFASEVLENQTDVRLAAREQRRTDWVMHHLENRNKRVGYLVDVLEHLQLLRPRDIILNVSALNLPSPCPPASSPPTPPTSQFDPPPKEGEAPPNLSTLKLSTMGDEGGGVLPRPAPPPSCLRSGVYQPPQPLSPVTCCNATVMCWPYEEVHAGTDGFSPALQIGEGGFGIVYRASLRNIDCAIKRLKEDSLLDLTLLRESFKTEVEKLSEFRHSNIVDLLGFSKGEGSMCLIYSYMENRSLEDRLHNKSVTLTWSQRIRIVEGASAALQFLHSSPKNQKPLIHGDVKSSNILLDRHLEAKLSDFGLARFSPAGSPASSASQTASVGKTTTVRGTLAYLPEEYVRNGELGTTVDVFSFGVVLLEVLTGRRAVEKDPKPSEKYLKDLVEDLEHCPAEAWRNQLDERMMAGGIAEPAGFLQVAALACESLRKNRKKRPTMAIVFDKLKDVHKLVMKASSTPSSSSSAGTDQHNSMLQPPYSSFPTLSGSPDPSVGALAHKLSKLGPLEDTYPSQFSSSSCSSLTSADRLHSSPLLPLTSSASLAPISSSSFVGPCETDESRGFSQYSLCSLSNGTSYRSLSPSTRDQQEKPTEPKELESSQPSVPVQDQYDFPDEPNCTTYGNHIGSDTRVQPSAHLSGLSPGRSLHSASSGQSPSPGYSVLMNPSKQRLLEKKSQYEEGRIETPELLSDDLYGLRSCEDFRGPEESDELDYLPIKQK